MSESSAPRGQGVVWLDDPPFRRNAAAAVDDTQLRHNIRHATTTIRERRNQRVAELPDWPRLRAAAAAIKDDVLAHLDRYLEQFEERVSAHGAQVHWARDATEANQIVVDISPTTLVNGKPARASSLPLVMDEDRVHLTGALDEQVGEMTVAQRIDLAGPVAGQVISKGAQVAERILNETLVAFMAQVIAELFIRLVGIGAAIFHLA